MIIGKDQLENLQNWYQYKYIIKNIDIICFNRKNISNKRVKNDYEIKKIKHLKFNCNYSSTKIRKILKDNIHFDVCSLDKKVFEYIIRNNIYIS